MRIGIADSRSADTPSLRGPPSGGILTGHMIRCESQNARSAKGLPLVGPTSPAGDGSEAGVVRSTNPAAAAFLVRNERHPLPEELNQAIREALASQN